MQKNSQKRKFDQTAMAERLLKAASPPSKLLVGRQGAVRGKGTRGPGGSGLRRSLPARAAILRMTSSPGWKRNLAKALTAAASSAERNESSCRRIAAARPFTTCETAPCTGGPSARLLPLAGRHCDRWWQAGQSSCLHQTTGVRRLLVRTPDASALASPHFQSPKRPGGVNALWRVYQLVTMASLASEI